MEVKPIDSIKTMTIKNRFNKYMGLALALFALAACSESQSPQPKATLLPATGQVMPEAVKPTSIRAYAAARFLDQASFGPSPAALARSRQLDMKNGSINN